MEEQEPQTEASASERIDENIDELADWRGETLARVRRLIHRVEPDIVEEWRWRGVPVWSRAGIVCTGETDRDKVRLTFPKGASLEDPSKLFNASLEGKVRRAIDIHEAGMLDEAGLGDLVCAAVSLNLEGSG